jgi:hypothetical protein
MNGFFSTLGWGLTALVFVSVLVALIEYLREVSRPPRLPEPLPRRAAHVDVDLTALPEASHATNPGDQGERQATLDETLARMARPTVDPAWIETSPMVLGARQQPQPSASATTPG